MLHISDCLKAGMTLPEDARKILEPKLKALEAGALKGDYHDQFTLGCFHRIGLYLPEEQCMIWFAKAAAENPDILHIILDCIDGGMKLSDEVRKILELLLLELEDRASKGESDAQEKLEYYKRGGLSLEKNIEDSNSLPAGKPFTPYQASKNNAAADKSQDSEIPRAGAARKQVDI